MTRTVPFIAAAAGICLLLFCPLASNAATVFVEGPAGASVEINGESFGELPWDEARELGQGPHFLRVRLSGHLDFESELSVSGDDDNAYVVAELLPLDRNIAAVSSLFLAGLGQHYQGRKIWGWGFMAAQLASVGVAVLAEDQFKSHRADFERAQLAYDNAISEPVFRAEAAKMAAAWTEMEDAETLRDIALYSAVGIAVVSAIEAWWSVGRAIEPLVDVSSVLSERQLRVGLGGSF
jgi:hypothetical protein